MSARELFLAHVLFFLFCSFLWGNCLVGNKDDWKEGSAERAESAIYHSGRAGVSGAKQIMSLVLLPGKRASER